jgi:oligoendopeptidase F
MNQYTTSWDLSKYYYLSEADPQIQRDLTTLKSQIDKFIDTYKGQLPNLTPTQWLQYFQDESEISKLAGKVEEYFYFARDLQTQDQTLKKLQGEIDLSLAQYREKLLFIDEEFRQMGVKKLNQLANQNELLAYHNFFIKKSNSIQNLLELNQENIILKKDESLGKALLDIYNELVSSLKFDIEIDGELKQVNEEEIRSMRMSPDRDIRKKAFISIQNTYSNPQIQMVLSNVYNGIVKDWVSESKLRSYTGVMTPRNQSEQLEDDLVDTLLETITSSFSLVERFYKAKAKHLGLENLCMWDTLAPLEGGGGKYEYGQAMDLFLDCMQGFDSQFYDISKEILTTGLIDVFPNQGKRGGAYCSYDKYSPSLILTNFTNDANSITTIAHEMGHAIHATLSKVQPYHTYWCGLALGETASVFNETMWGQYYLEKVAKTKQEKTAYLDHYLSDQFSTIFLQVMYTNFERVLHTQIQQGQEFGSQEANQIWKQLGQEYFGSSVENSDENKGANWLGIGHFFRSPFYCYTYSFANLVSLSLYKQYQDQGPQFITRYKELLKAGGSAAPKELLLSQGIDITSPQFYKQGLQILEEMLVEYEGLSNS